MSFTTESCLKMGVETVMKKEGSSDSFLLPTLILAAPGSGKFSLSAESFIPVTRDRTAKAKTTGVMVS